MKRTISLLLALACLLALCACGGAEPSPDTPDDAGAAALAAPVYPSMAPQPNQADYAAENGWDVDESYYDAYRAWRADLDAMRNQPEGYADGLEAYFQAGIRQFLADSEGENRVFSPLNLYMALAMLAEVTDGESRRQILDLMSAESLDALRQQAGALWRASYQDDGVVTSLLASSLWMRQDMSYVPETLENLAKYYYASSFQGEMGSAEYDALLQAWINEQTGGLLREQASGLHMNARTVLALATTIYFKAPWVDSFYEGSTESGVFHSPDGGQTVDFMHRSDNAAYYWGDRFAAVGLGMENGGAMWLMLPDEGLTPEALLNDPEAMAFLLLSQKADWEKQKHVLVKLALPKFDVSSDLDLVEGLQALGITDVFDFDAADFSPLTRDTEEIAVTQAKHATRVLIDEEGCEAAAYTVIMMLAGAAMPPDEEVDFILDRPFVFVITNADGLPLFVGIVNHPAE